MHHPGPPRFVSVGDAVDLAPRDPDPAASYSWSIERAPADSAVRLDDRPVQPFRPDEPGRYVLALDAPDGVHRLTIRCFPGTPGSEPRGERGIGPRSGSGGILDVRGEEAGSSGGAPAPGGSMADGRPRVRLDGRVEGDDVVLEATPAPTPDAAETAGELDVEFAFDDRDHLEATAATVEGRRLRVPVDRLPERARIHAVAVGEGGHSVADAVEIRSGSDGTPGAGGPAVRRLYDPPAWATDAAYYEVYVRTFAPGADHGSTLEAIGDRLDHLVDLGVDVLWLTPVLENDHAPHGYNITDFFAVAADLGDRADYRRLIERAHERDLKVLFDLVLNHSARDHPYFRDAYGDPGSDYREWYEWQDSGEPGTYFDWEHIANFDFSSLEVRRHLLNVVDAWAPLVDGFRCDMAWAVPNSFWREIRERVKADDPAFLLLDETIPYIPDFQEDMFDVHFDSTTYATMRSVGTGWAPADAILDAVAERRAVGFPDHAGFLLYAENHDESRYLVECGRPAARAAAGALCTLPGAPLVYAGQELGQLGKRDDLVWEGTDEALADHYRRLLRLRRTAPALASEADLSRVDYEVRGGDPDRVLAFARVAAGSGDDSPGDAAAGRAGIAEEPGSIDAAVVLCNFGADRATVALGPEVATVDAVTGEAVDAGSGVRVDDVVVLATDASAVDGGA